MNEQGIIVNKYGAVDAQEVIKLIGRVRQLERIIDKMAGVNGWPKELDRLKAHNYYMSIMYDLPEDFNKMKELTKVDDYEYQITPEIKKLVKKQK